MATNGGQVSHPTPLGLLWGFIGGNLIEQRLSWCFIWFGADKRKGILLWSMRVLQTSGGVDNFVFSAGIFQGKKNNKGSVL